jgi:hypothetical protein
MVWGASMGNSINRGIGGAPSSTQSLSIERVCVGEIVPTMMQLSSCLDNSAVGEQ